MAADLTISVGINASGTKRGEADAKRSVDSIVSHAERSGKRVSSAFNIDFQALSQKLKQYGQQIQQIGQSMQSLGTQMSLAITLPLAAIGKLAVDSALEVDRAGTKIKALLGSQEAANKKIAELRDLANKSVGVTQAAAIETFAQLKGIGGVAEESINKMIQAMGKLNAAFNIDDQAGFMRNLTQIFSQGFERADIKEAIGRVPFFEQLLEQAFGTKDAEKLKELKNAGQLTMDTFMSGLSDAIQNDPRIANISENLTTKLTKAFERLNVALAPLGQVILDTLVPILEKAAPYAEELGKWFADLSPSAKSAAVAIAAFAAAIGPALVVIGTLVAAIGSIVSGLGVLIGSGGTIAIVVAALLGLGIQLAPVIAAAAAWYAAWQTNFGGIRDLVSTLAAWLQETWNAMMTALSELTAELLAEIKTFWEQNGEDIKRAVETLSEAIRSIWTAVLDFWRQHGEEIKAVTSAVWAVIKEIVKGTLEAVLGIIKAVTAIINGDWSKFWDGIKMIVEGNGRAISALLTAAGQLWLAAVRTALDAIWALHSWLYEQAARLARAIIDGLVAGLKAGTAPIATAAKGLVTVPLNILRSGFGIHSPSKVTEEIGGFITQGMAIGINGGQGDVRQAAGDLIRGTLDIMLDGTMSWSDKLKNIFGNIAKSFKDMLINMATNWLNNNLFGSNGAGGGGGLSLGGLFGGNQGGGIFNFGGGGSTANNSIITLPNGEQAVQVNGSGGGLFGRMGGLSGMFGMIGGGLGILGGAIGGRAGGFLSNIGTGVGIGAQIGSIIPGIGTVIGAAVGGIVGLFSSIFGGDPKRKRDKNEKIPALNQGFADALRQLRELVGDVRTLRVDPDSALAKAAELRQQIASGFGLEFESKKYRKQAKGMIADKLREADGLIQELRAAADIARAAGERSRRIIPEFAGGVFMSPAFQAFRAVNGMLPGTFTGRDRIPAMLADGEMVLNPRQQRRVRMNAGGRDVFSNAGIPGYAGGGMVSAPAASGGPVVVQLTFEHSIDADGMVHTALKSPQNQDRVKVIVEDKYANDSLKLKRRGA